MTGPERNEQLLKLTLDYVHGLLTDDEFSERTALVMWEYNLAKPAKLKFGPCDCIAAGHCHAPGTRGHLYVDVMGKFIDVAPCRYCGK